MFSDFQDTEDLLGRSIHKEGIEGNVEVEEGDGRDGGRTRPSRFKPCERHDYTDHCNEISGPAELQVEDSAQSVNRKRTYSVANYCDISPDSGKEELHDSAVTEASIETGVVHYSLSVVAAKVFRMRTGNHQGGGELTCKHDEDCDRRSLAIGRDGHHLCPCNLIPFVLVVLFFDLEILSVSERVIRVVLVVVKSYQDSHCIIVSILTDHWWCKSAMIWPSNGSILTPTRGFGNEEDASTKYQGWHTLNGERNSPLRSAGMHEIEAKADPTA